MALYDDLATEAEEKPAQRLSIYADLPSEKDPPPKSFLERAKEKVTQFFTGTPEEKKPEAAPTRVLAPREQFQEEATAAGLGPETLAVSHEPAIPQAIISPQPEEALGGALTRAADAIRTEEIRTLRQQEPVEWTRRSLPELLGAVPVRPRPSRELSQKEVAKAQDIVSIATETGLPPSFVEEHFDDFTQKLGLRGVPTRAEMIQLFIAAGIAQGAITAPIATALGLGTFMGIKEAESVVTQSIKGEKIKPLQGRELMEFLGPLPEPENTIAQTMEFIAPGFLGAKVMGKTREALAEKLKKKIIGEAWEDFLAKRAEGEKGRLLPGPKTVEEQPQAALPPPPPTEPQAKLPGRGPTPQLPGEPPPDQLPPGKTPAPKALPPGQGFALVQPLLRTLIRPKLPGGYPVRFDEEGEPVYPPGKGPVTEDLPQESIYSDLPSGRELRRPISHEPIKAAPSKLKEEEHAITEREVEKGDIGEHPEVGTGGLSGWPRPSRSDRVRQGRDAEEEKERQVIEQISKEDAERAEGKPEEVVPILGKPLSEVTEAEIEEAKGKAEGTAPRKEVLKEGQGQRKEPPVPEGMARFYHGGTLGEGPRWVSPDYEYAKGYAEKTPGAKVQYVDIPKDSPLLEKAFDDTGSTVKAPYISFEAPAEIMKGAKEVVKEPTPVEVGIEKQPWEMTRDEYQRTEIERLVKEGIPRDIAEGEVESTLPFGSGGALSSPKNKHLAIVNQALSQNKPVPPEVLKDYPELQKSTQKPALDLTVTGQAKESPDRPYLNYTVNKRKPDFADDRIFRVVMSKTEGGFLSVAANGETAQKAYDNALTEYDRKMEERKALLKPRELPEIPKEEKPNLESLFDSYQAMLKTLPSNIGKAKQEGKLSQRQLRALQNIDDIEKIVKPYQEEWDAISKKRYVEAKEVYEEAQAKNREDSRKKLAEAGLKEGDTVKMVSPSFLPGAPGGRYEGTIKVDKNGNIYVLSQGTHYDLFRNPWKKVEEIEEKKPSFKVGDHVVGPQGPGNIIDIQTADESDAGVDRAYVDLDSRKGTFWTNMSSLKAVEEGKPEKPSRIQPFNEKTGVPYKYKVGERVMVKHGEKSYPARIARIVGEDRYNVTPDLTVSQAAELNLGSTMEVLEGNIQKIETPEKPDVYRQEFNDLIEKLRKEGARAPETETMGLGTEKYTRKTRDIVRDIIDFIGDNRSDLLKLIPPELGEYFYNYAPYLESKHEVITETPHAFKATVQDENLFQEGSFIRRKSSTPGVVYVMAERPDLRGAELQAVSFDKKQFTKDQAQAWWDKNKDRLAPKKEATPEGYSYKDAGYQSEEALNQHYKEAGLHDYGESLMEFLQRAFCSGIVPK